MNLRFSPFRPAGVLLLIAWAGLVPRGEAKGNLGDLFVALADLAATIYETEQGREDFRPSTEVTEESVWEAKGRSRDKAYALRHEYLRKDVEFRAWDAERFAGVSRPGVPLKIERRRRISAVADARRDWFLEQRKANAKPVNYDITVETSDKADAGTDSTITLTLNGNQTVRLELNPLISGDAFRQGKTDRLVAINQPQLMRLESITVSSDGKWSGAGWHLKKVTVDVPGVGLHTFVHNGWIEGKSRTVTLRPSSVGPSKYPTVTRPDFSFPRLKYTTPLAFDLPFCSAQGWTPGRNPRFLKDVNGDKRADIVGFSNDAVLVSLATPSGFAPPAKWSDDFGWNDGWSADSAQRAMADVNGDSREDIVGFHPTRGVVVALSTGKDFAPAAVWSQAFGGAQGWARFSLPKEVRDITGDGKADIVAVRTDSVRRGALDFPVTRVYVAPSNGRRFQDPVMREIRLPEPADLLHLRVARVGTGVASALALVHPNVRVMQWGDLASPSGPAAPASTRTYPLPGFDDLGDPLHHPRTFADANGDGFEDLFHFSADGVYLSLTAPDGTFQSPQFIINNLTTGAGAWDGARHPRMVGDVNGDGTADVLGFGEGSVFLSLGIQAR